MNYAYRLILDANELYKDKDFNKALEYYENSLEIDGQNPDCLRGKGNCLQHLERGIRILQKSPRYQTRRLRDLL